MVHQSFDDMGKHSTLAKVSHYGAADIMNGPSANATGRIKPWLPSAPIGELAAEYPLASPRLPLDNSEGLWR
jgi:hypothetical protein